jgi:ABC-type uncharacterized transport system fused permease/ATPase subunit
MGGVALLLRICLSEPSKATTDHETRSATSPSSLLPSWIRNSAALNLFFLFLFSLLYEVASIGVMKIISKFYLSVTSQDIHLFLNCLVQALLLVTLISIFKSFKIYYSDRIALQCRYKIVRYLHENYIGAAGAGYLIQERRDIIDHPDQRATQDVDRLTKEMSSFLVNVMSLPGILLFYTIYLWLTVGPFAPLMCYLYFLIGSFCSYFQARALIPLVYEQEKLEGAFRASHVNYQSNIESIALLKGEQDEERRLNRHFDSLVSKVSEIMNQELWLNLIVNWFSYLGAIINYAVIGASVLYFSQNSHSAESDLASELASGSYACLYLISGLTTLLSTYESISKICALSNRVVELIEAVQQRKALSSDMRSLRSLPFPPHVAEVELTHPPPLSNEVISPLGAMLRDNSETLLLKIENFKFSFPANAAQCGLTLEVRRGRRFSSLPLSPDISLFLDLSLSLS